MDAQKAYRKSSSRGAFEGDCCSGKYTHLHFKIGPGVRIDDTVPAFLQKKKKRRWASVGAITTCMRELRSFNKVVSAQALFRYECVTFQLRNPLRILPEIWSYFHRSVCNLDDRLVQEPNSTAVLLLYDEHRPETYFTLLFLDYGNMKHIWDAIWFRGSQIF